VSAAAERHAEILKLARLLGRDPGTIAYMAEVPAADIRELREQVAEVLFSASHVTLGRLAAASRLLPVGLVAKIGEHAFGPVLSARIAGMLDPGRAMEMAGKLPVGFLAEVAMNIDPRRASDVIARVPARQVAQITAELARREEYVAMGRFVAYLPPEGIAAAVEAMDDEALLRVAFVLESKERLHELVSLLPEARIDGILDAAARAHLWMEALDLLANLDDSQRREFAKRTGTRDAGVVDSLVQSARELELWPTLLPLAADLEPEAQERVADSVRKLDLEASERERVLDYARTQGLLDGLGPLLRAVEGGG